MILLDYFIYGTYRFFVYVAGKNRDDARLLAPMASAIFIIFIIYALSEAHIIYSGISVDANFIKHEGGRFLYWLYPSLSLALPLIYCIFRKNKLEILDTKYQSFSNLKRKVIKWLLILIYTLIPVLTFWYERYIEAMY
ncbi:hypothetical protein [uncultured Bacteroides sp.]|uniref:hypothetical protein n=1 Tax=uncultured Bacteroides sp. TaxID=162156 RepID=UPI0025EB3A14|nr:hypothetical protein [uncultured Bacteroides sp.]